MGRNEGTGQITNESDREYTNSKKDSGLQLITSIQAIHAGLGNPTGKWGI